jgi:hypothetical protein
MHSLIASRPLVSIIRRTTATYVTGMMGMIREEFGLCPGEPPDQYRENTERVVNLREGRTSNVEGAC